MYYIIIYNLGLVILIILPSTRKKQKKTISLFVVRSSRKLTTGDTQ